MEKVNNFMTSFFISFKGNFTHSTRIASQYISDSPIHHWTSWSLCGIRYFLILLIACHRIIQSSFPLAICYLAHSLFFSFFKRLYQSITDLQCCVSFCCITKWSSYMYMYIPISPPSCISLPPSLSQPSRWLQSTELISLCYAAASH